MRFEWKPCLLATVVGAALLAAATPATAQVMGSPFNRSFPGTTPFGITQGTGYPAYTPATIANTPAVSSNPYLGSAATLTNTPDPFYNPSPYAANPYSSYYNPAGGFLSGAADLVNARANSTVTYQKALLTQEEAFRSQLDTRRKIWEEARYERASLMNSEQWRLRQLQSALERARNDPPQEEIWSAQSLNDLFKYLDAQQGRLTPSQIDQLPRIALSEDILKHINLTTGKDGNIGLLKNEIRWPTALQRPEFEEARKSLEAQLQEAVGQAKNVGQVKSNLVSDIKINVQKMQDTLLNDVNKIQPADYSDGEEVFEQARRLGSCVEQPECEQLLQRW